MTDISRAVSRTVRVSGPTWSSDQESGGVVVGDPGAENLRTSGHLHASQRENILQRQWHTM